MGDEHVERTCRLSSDSGLASLWQEPKQSNKLLKVTVVKMRIIEPKWTENRDSEVNLRLVTNLVSCVFQRWQRRLVEVKTPPYRRIPSSRQERLEIPLSCQNRSLGDSQCVVSEEEPPKWVGTVSQ